MELYLNLITPCMGLNWISESIHNTSTLIKKYSLSVLFWVIHQSWHQLICWSSPLCPSFFRKWGNPTEVSRKSLHFCSLDHYSFQIQIYIFYLSKHTSGSILLIAYPFFFRKQYQLHTRSHANCIFLRFHRSDSIQLFSFAVHLSYSLFLVSLTIFPLFCWCCLLSSTHLLLCFLPSFFLFSPTVKEICSATLFVLH